MKRVFCLILLLAASTAVPASASQIYRWVDDNGVTQFTAHPPKNRESTRISTQTGHSEPVDYSDFTNNNDEPDDETPTAAQRSGAGQNQERCDVARENLEILQAGGRIAVEENGERRYLDDDERRERTEEARNIIAEDC